MGEVGGTDFHYDGERKRPAYPWKCPACDANNIGRIEEGCPQCSAGKDGKQVGIPKGVKRARPMGAGRPATTAQPAAAGAGRFDSSTAPRPLRTLPAPEPLVPESPVEKLVGAAQWILQTFVGTTQPERVALKRLERAVQAVISAGVALVDVPVSDAPAPPREPRAYTPEEADEVGVEPVQLNGQLLDARTILTLAAALDHFAEQILANITSDDFLSVDEAQDLANQLRATLPDDLDSVLPQISAEEPEGEAQP